MGRLPASVRDGVAAWLRREKWVLDGAARAAPGVWHDAVRMVSPRSQRTRSAVTVIEASMHVS